MFKRSKGYITTTNPNTLRIKNVPPPKSENENILKKGHTIIIDLCEDAKSDEIFLKEGDIFFEEDGFFITEKKDEKFKCIVRHKINKDAVLMITHIDRASLKEEEDEENSSF